MPLTDEQVDRYSRQIILPEVGGVGQERLLRARVRVSDSGRIAVWASRYLVAAGVGELALEPRLAGELRGALADLNPDCHIEVEDGSRAERPPVVLLASAGDAAIARAWDIGIPAVVASLRGAAGDLTMLSPSHPSSSCPVCAGVEQRDEDRPGDDASPSAAPFIAVVAASEVLKVILGAGDTLYGRRLRYDARTQAIDDARLVCRPGCTRRAA